MAKVPKTGTLKNKCDKLLSPVLRKLKPDCLLCGAPTQVAHHHVHKSKSNRLRYELENLINLCNGCHFKLHHNESYWASKIVEIKGLKWFKELEKMKNETVKTDYLFYEANLTKLEELLYGN